MVAAMNVQRIPLYFLYRKLGTVEYSRSDTDSDGWRLVEGAHPRSSRIAISHVTTRGPPAGLPRLPVTRAELTCDLGSLLFRTYPPNTLYAVAVIPGVARLYISGLDRDTLQLVLVPDRAAREREYHVVFDLDETLIFNPMLVPNPPPGSEPVNPYPPHHINDVIDTPRLRPNVLPFLQLVCPFFNQVRVCTMSIRQRATPIVNYMDPKQQTLLKNQRTMGKAIISREDITGSEFWMLNPMPPTKSLEQCMLPSGKEFRTVILDDSWEIWGPGLRENLVAVMPPGNMGGMSHDVYLNGEDGGVLGKYMLVCLMNLALKEERRQDLIAVPVPVGLTGRAAFPAMAYTPAVYPTGGATSAPSYTYISPQEPAKQQLPYRPRSQGTDPVASPPPTRVLRMASPEGPYGVYAAALRAPTYRYLDQGPPPPLPSLTRAPPGYAMTRQV